jgi:hypothetical protein
VQHLFNVADHSHLPAYTRPVVLLPQLMAKKVTIRGHHPAKMMASSVSERFFAEVLADEPTEEEQRGDHRRPKQGASASYVEGHRILR